MKPLTSLPLSPTSAITFTSASILREIMPMSVLLPTPLPENIPILWPLPQVSSESIAFTPIVTGSFIWGRSNGFDGAHCAG